jgi:hypothetical protein
MDAPTEELTVTVTAFTLLPLPPQPAAKHAAAITAAMQVKIVRNFIPPPPKQTRIAGTSARSVLTLPTFSNLSVAAIRKSG